MNINECQLGIEAFYDCISGLDTDVLCKLSLTNTDWWTATYEELARRRLESMHTYFPMIQDGYLHSEKENGTSVHIDDTCIHPNAMLRIGKLLHAVKTRKPHAKHPSYDCIFQGDTFHQETDLDDPSANRRFFHTLYFLLGCAACEDPNPSRNQVLCNVCMMCLMLQYIYNNARYRHSQPILKNVNMRSIIREKVQALQKYLSRRYLPNTVKQRIRKIISDMHSIGF